jgi:hypothetical protein
MDAKEEIMGTINYVCKRRPRYSGVFSFGNSKLPYSTAVFNMTAVTGNLYEVTRFGGGRC